MKGDHALAPASREKGFSLITGLSGKWKDGKPHSGLLPYTAICSFVSVPSKHLLSARSRLCYSANLRLRRDCAMSLLTASVSPRTQFPRPKLEPDWCLLSWSSVHSIQIQRTVHPWAGLWIRKRSKQEEEHSGCASVSTLKTEAEKAKFIPLMFAKCRS